MKFSEDDLHTFEGWLRYQGIDAATTPPDELAMWRNRFNKAMECSLASPKVGTMKLRAVPGEHRYAVAVREDSNLWLMLWVRRSRKGFFVMIPRGDRDWDPHTTYHQDGTSHSKGYGSKLGMPKSQPLTGTFRGTEQLGTYMGYGPKSVGAVCDPTAFSGVVEVAPGVLGPAHGSIIIDLVEPGCEPAPAFNPIVQQEVFRDTLPWIVIRIANTEILLDPCNLTDQG